MVTAVSDLDSIVREQTRLYLEGVRQAEWLYVEQHRGRESIAAQERALADLEAEWVVAGLLVGERAPKNAEEREAALRLKRRADERARRIEQQIASDRTLLWQTEAAYKTAEHTIGLAKRALDYAIAATRVQAESRS